MPEESSNQPQQQAAKSKTIPAVLSAMIASWTLTQCSLHGVNFETMGLSSEIVKALIVGHLVGFFTWISWRNIVSAIRDLILSIRGAFKTWREAARNGKE